MLRFSPAAWAKLLYLRDLGSTEIGGFGISPFAEDPLYVSEFRIIKQRCSSVHVEFDDAALADFFEDCVDEGLKPNQFARIWIHTHPGNSAAPSSTDESTFARVFSRPDWAVMFILACGGDTYARLGFNVGPCADMLITHTVDCSKEFAGSDLAGWQEEYKERVKPELSTYGETKKKTSRHRKGQPQPVSRSLLATPDPESFMTLAGQDVFDGDLQEQTTGFLDDSNEYLLADDFPDYGSDHWSDHWDEYIQEHQG